MLRLTAEDLANVRMSSVWGPFNEALMSLPLLRGPRPSLLVDGWRRTAGHQPLEGLAPLVALTPRQMLFDLHTVVGAAPSIGHALERLEAAPAAHLRAELDWVDPWIGGEDNWARRWRRDLAEGDREARHELVGLLDKYHTSAIEPFWDRLGARLEAERARCARVMAAGGVGELLRGLHPKVVWRPPILDVNPWRDGNLGGRVENLAGRTLLLAPSVFCIDRPWLVCDLRDSTAPTHLIYPVLRGIDDAAPLWTARAAPGRQALARLLGATRASALDAIADGSTTTELARRLGVSPATASHHVGVLRDARLVWSRREGNAVRHHLTDLGAGLLDGRHRELGAN